MIETVPVDSAALLHRRLSGPGVSNQAESVAEALEQNRMVALAQPRHRIYPLVEQLMDLYLETRSPSWKGDLGERVRPGAAEEAMSVLLAVPASLPLPELTLEPSGAMGIEWWFGPEHNFVVSLTGNGVLEYAALLGPISSAHGREVFHDTLPTLVLEGLHSAQRRWSEREAHRSARAAL